MLDTRTQREMEALLDPAKRVLMRTGILETGQKFVFRCPMCGRIEENDQRMSPVCTGPKWTDDHPLEPMVLV